MLGCLCGKDSLLRLVVVSVVGLEIFLFTGSACADPTPLALIEVRQNEYIIEPPDINVSAAKELSAKANDNDFQILREIGSHHRLVGRNLEYAHSSSSDGIVPFDETDTFCSELLSAGLARSCTPNFVIRASLTPNDPRIFDLWGLDTLNGVDATGAWDISTGSKEVVVAVLDSGIDFNHPDIAPNLWTNPLEIPGNGVDDDGNGYIDDIHGAGFFRYSSSAIDRNGHGTHVAGTIGASGNNALGVTGVMWETQLLALKVLDDQGAGSWAEVLEAVDYILHLKQRGVPIVVANASWGGGLFDSALRDSIKRLADANIAFVAAAGNAGRNTDLVPMYPADYDLPNIVSVGALDQSGALASFSNYGLHSVDVAAPGVDILSTLPGGGYGYFSGTSMATPIVSGALALLASHEPDLSAEQLLAVLNATGTSLPSLSGVTKSGSRVNVARMMRRDETLPVLPPTTLPDTAACSYHVEEIPYAPDYSADGQAIAVQADEGAYGVLPLRFSFPFHRRQISVVKVSPNGLIYLVDNPPILDYRNEESAPTNTIAALQTDLVAKQDPYGVRMISTDENTTVYWKAKHYKHTAGGDVEVRTTLYPDGTIETFLTSPDSSVVRDLQRNATIGLRGDHSESAVTFAYNSERVRNHLGVRFTPMCDVPRVSVDALVAFGTTNKGSLSTRGVPRNQVIVELFGQGTGQAMVEVALGRRRCADQLPVTLTGGYGTVAAILPRNSGKFKSVSFTSSGVKTRLPIKSKRKKQSEETGNNRARNRRLTAQCRVILQSLRRTATNYASSQ